MTLRSAYYSIRHAGVKRVRRLYRVIDKASFWKKKLWYCPCCNTRLYRWKEGKFGKQPKLYNPERYKSITYPTICPVCNSLQRHRIIVEYLKSGKINLQRSRILYFAVEECVGDWLKSNKIGYDSADLYQCADLQIDIEDTGLEDKSYDLIVCNHVLEHVNDYKRALGELHRILTDQGLLICSFPMDLSLDTVYEDETITSRDDRIKHFGQYDHLRIFGKDSRKIIEDVGFRVSTVDEELLLSEAILLKAGPAEYDLPIVFVCRK